MEKHSSGESTPIGNRSTRISCDRCYSQKLKCLRMTEQGPCKRCSRAGAQCTSSPAKRMGRPVRANKTSTTKRKGARTTASQIGQAAAGKQHEIPEKDGSSTIDTHKPVSDSEIHEQDDIWNTCGIGDDVFEPAHSEPNLFDSFTFCDTNTTTTLLAINEWPTPTSLPPEHFQYQDMGVENWALDPDLDLNINLESSLSCHSQIGSYSQEFMTASASTPESIDGTPTNPQYTIRESSLHDTPLAIDPGHSHHLPQQEFGDDYMERNITQLSLLNTRLYGILRRMKRGPWNDRASDSESAESSTGTSSYRSACGTELFPVGEILETSQLFLDLLTAFTPAVVTALDREQPLRTTPQDLPMPGLNLDTSTVIEMLTCFIRLRRLYHGLFAYIRQSLLGSSARQFLDIKTLPYILTGTGTFGLPESWNLQLIALVQISDRLLQTMERALGVPSSIPCQEHKLAENIIRSGIVAQHVAKVELMGIWCSMEVMDNLEHFDGGRNSLKDDIKDVKNILKNSLCL